MMKPSLSLAGHWTGLLLAWLVVSTCLTQGAENDKSFNSAGVMIHYTVEGTGPPIVLIHGLHSSADMNWRAPGIIKELALHYQVISLDVRGHGHSDKPDGENSYGVELAEDIVRLLDHLKIQQAHIVGYSMGGMIAMKLVVRHPDRVTSVVLGGMGWLKEGSWLQSFWERLPDREAVKTPTTPTACVHSLAKLAITENELRAIQVPVTVIVGDRDPVRKLYVFPLRRARNDWPVIEIEDAGHLTCIMKKQFKQELVDVLNRQHK